MQFYEKFFQMLQLLRNRLIMQTFCNQQRFCRSEKGAMNDKEIGIQTKTSQDKLNHELETEKEEKPYEDPNLPKHRGGIHYCKETDSFTLKD